MKKYFMQTLKIFACDLEVLALALLLGQEVDGEAAPLRAARLELAPVHVQVASTEDTRTCSLCGFSI